MSSPKGLSNIASLLFTRITMMIPINRSTVEDSQTPQYLC